MDAKKTHAQNILTCMSPKMITILGSVVSIIGGPIWSFDDHENIIKSRYSYELLILWRKYHILELRYLMFDYVREKTNFVVFSMWTWCLELANSKQRIGPYNPRNNGAQALDNPWSNRAHELDNSQAKIFCVGVRQLPTDGCYSVELDNYVWINQYSWN